MADHPRVSIDLGACIRAGECYYNHPELIRHDAAGDPELIVTDLDTDTLQRHALEAAEVCPAQAIRVAGLQDL